MHKQSKDIIISTIWIGNTATKNMQCMEYCVIQMVLKVFEDFETAFRTWARVKLQLSDAFCRSVLEWNGNTWGAQTGTECANAKLYKTSSFLKRLLMVFPTLLQDVCEHCYWLESVAWLSLVKLSQAKRAMVKCQCWQMLLHYLSHNEFSLSPSLSLSVFLLFPLTPCPANTVNCMTIRDEWRLTAASFLMVACESM